MTAPAAEPRTETDAVIEVAQRAVTCELIRDADNVLVAGVPDGVTIETLDLVKYAGTPRRKTGGPSLRDAASFAAYVTRHKTSATLLYADRNASRVVAVFNDHEATNEHGEGVPGWGDFRATLNLTLTPEWQHWLSLDGKYVSQSQFAEHIEQGELEIVKPPAADMREIAQHFQAHQKVEWKSVNVLQNGARQMCYAETIEAKAGQRGELVIPQEFTLAVAPYEGSEPYPLVARLRYRLDDGRLLIGYVLVRPLDVVRAAFTAVLDAIKADTGLTPLLGTYGG